MDIDYESYALKLAHGQWTAPYSGPTARWAMVVPLALLYWIFGFHVVVSTAIPLACSIGAVYLGYLFAAWLRGERAGIIAAMIMAFFPLDIIYATQVMVDVPLSFCYLLALYWFMLADKSGSAQAKRLYFVLSGCALGIAYGFKVEAMIALPFFGVYYLLKGKMERAFGFTVITLMMTLLVEGLIFQEITGNFFGRLLLTFGGGAQRAAVQGGLDPEVYRNYHSISSYAKWMLVDIHYVGPSFIVLTLTAGVAWLRKEMHSDYRLRNCGRCFCGRL